MESGILKDFWNFWLRFLWAFLSRNISFLSNYDPEEGNDEDDIAEILDYHKTVEEPVTEIRWAPGEVTRVAKDHFIVDGKYYWPLDLPISDRGLKEKCDQEEIAVGCKVRSKLERFGDHEEWRVIDVHDDERDTDWYEESNVPTWMRNNIFDQDTDDNLVNAVVNKISHPDMFLSLSAGNGSGSDLIQCPLNVLSDTFMPWKGDCLTLKVEKGEKNSIKVLHAKPLRFFSGTNYISSWIKRDECGVIDDIIFFCPENCANVYYPRSGDQVKFHAIECEPSSFNFGLTWRAVRVTPTTCHARSKQTDLKDQIQADLYRKSFTQLLEGKKGIKTENFIKLSLVGLEKTKTCYLDVSNDNEESVLLTCVKVVGGKRGNVVLNSVSSTEKLPVEIPAKSSYSLPLKCHAGMLGESKEIITLTFNDKIDIGTEFTFQVGDDAVNQLIPSSRFRPKSQLKYPNSTNVIRGERRVYNRPREFNTKRLGNYNVPEHLWKTLEVENESLMDRYPALADPLHYKNYKVKLGALLHLEEIGLVHRMAQFEMKKVVFVSAGEYLVLSVPGLSEKRPSLMLGDSVVATASDNFEKNSLEFSGEIHEVRSASILMKFHRDFHNVYCGEMYDVKFQINRGAFRRQHQAVELAARNLGKEVLFPAQVQTFPPQISVCVGKECSVRPYPPAVTPTPPRFDSSKLRIPRPLMPRDTGPEWVSPIVNRYEWKGNRIKNTNEFDTSKSFPFQFKMKDQVIPYTQKGFSAKKKLEWINKRLNREQKLAVKRILLGEARPLPYIIFGPPGTGKTVTLVEATLQMYLLRPDSRILVSTPSNSSADLILERIIDSKVIPKGQLARLNAFQRNIDVIKEKLRPYCHANEDLSVLRDVLRRRVLITTCSTAGQLHKMNIQGYSFSHCFLDEAGHTTEPEALLPIGLVSKDNCQIVLAGDPKQLGPVLLSKFARFYGLELSLLERLYQNRLYSRDNKLFKDHGGFDPLLVTKLLKNYRSHQSIIEVPSKLFYDNELQVCAPTERRTRFLGMPLLPNPKHPVVFNGVKGQNYQEEDSPSWFNPVEALTTVGYVQKLYNSGVAPEEIGIIAPYRKQSSKIRDLMDKFNLCTDNLKIGSVEEFQGQERPVIILTTVRSSLSNDANLVEMDVIQGLGFMQSEKRMNVALTRAQSLLIVCGDPHVLVGDESWKTFLESCCEKNCYIGCDLPMELTSIPTT